jgi:ribosomal protein L11 methyltransferase
VIRPQYTRYALRLGSPAGARPPAAPAAPVTPADCSSPGVDARPVRPDPVDDWSGAAAYATGPDAQALEYAEPAAVAAILALQPSGWQEEDDGRTLVFWLEGGAEADPEVGAALKRLGSLGRLQVEREPPGWEDAWRRFHKPHVIGRLYVRPPWYPARDDLLDIAVEAGLAFGTGGHASTRQCLELVQTLTPGSLLDLGSGSGVVSFAALKLGFTPVTGIDIDPVAVHAAAGNAAMNGLAPTFLVGDATDPGYPLPGADVVVANIALRPILRLAERWRPAEPDARAADAVAPAVGIAPPAGGTSAPAELLLSGLLVEQADEALAAFPAFTETARTDDGTWLTLHLTRRA